MINPRDVRQLALSFPETDEHPHFHRTAFRVKKKIFATLDKEKKRVMVRLSLVDQSVFCSIDPTIIYPVPGGWGRKGATYIELDKVKKTLFKDALRVAYCTVAPPGLAQQFLPGRE